MHHPHPQHHAGDGMGAHVDLAGSVLPALLIVAMLVLYLHAARRQGWNRWRRASFGAGSGLLLLAFAPALVALAHSDLRAHMVQHLLVGMLAPLGLALGAPMSLALRTLPTRAARGLTRVLLSHPSRVLTHPVAALALNVGGMYVLYLTPLYALGLAHPVVHHLIHLHFLLAGYLYVWAIAGPDPAPGRPGFGLRLGVLFAGMAAHAHLGKLMYIHLWPQGTAHPEAQVRAAAQLMYYGGDFAELLLAVVLFAGWYHARRPLDTAIGENRRHPA